MTNRGYPDDDGSRTPSGQHDLGRQRNSCYPAQNLSAPTTVAEMMTNRDSKNVYSTSAGDLSAPNGHWAVDGRASAGTAAYPPKPEDPNSQD